jgi:uncharacterized membrane protein YhaH (DUF805 family)
MISGLLILMLFASFFQPNRERLIAAVIFMAITLGSDLALGEPTGGEYYMQMALTDLLIISVLGIIPSISSLHRRLIYVSVAFIVVQIIGFTLWYTNESQVLYVILCAIMYTVTIITMIVPDNNVKGRLTDGYDSIISRIYRHFSAGRVHSGKGES